MRKKKQVSTSILLDGAFLSYKTVFTNYFLCLIECMRNVLFLSYDKTDRIDSFVYYSRFLSPVDKGICSKIDNLVSYFFYWQNQLSRKKLILFSLSFSKISTRVTVICPSCISSENLSLDEWRTTGFQRLILVNRFIGGFQLHFY